MPQESGAGAVVAIISLVLGAGGVALIRTLLNGVSTLKKGAIAREREAVDAVGRARDDADRGRDAAEKRSRLDARDRDYWHRIAAGYAAQLIRAGYEPMPAEPIPPSERGKPQ